MGVHHLHFTGQETEVPRDWLNQVNQLGRGKAGIWSQSPLSLLPLPLPFIVPGGISAESLTFTPLEDMIFLKWEEPQEPNGLITQYEVNGDSG